MSCDWCSHTDGQHLESIFGDERKCFADDCTCEVSLPIEED